MTASHSEEKSFELKITSLKDEIIGAGPVPDTLINLDKLLHIFDSRIREKQVSKDLIISIHEHIPKSFHKNFKLSQFFEAIKEFRRHSRGKIESAQLMLAKFQKERSEATEVLNQAKNESRDRSKSILAIEVIGLHELKVPPNKSIFIKLTCYQTQFKTVTKPYIEYMKGCKDKFSFEIQTGFERVDIQVNTPSTNQPEELIGETQVHFSSIHDNKHKVEMLSLYNGKSYSAVGNLELGIQSINSKVEYMESVIDKLDEHAKLQIEEIEEFEKKLKSLNSWLFSSHSRKTHLSPRQSGKRSHKRTRSDNSISANSKDKIFTTIVEAQDKEESSDSSTSSELEVTIPNFRSYSAIPSNSNIVSDSYFNTPKEQTFVDSYSNTPKIQIFPPVADFSSSGNLFERKSVACHGSAVNIHESDLRTRATNSLDNNKSGIHSGIVNLSRGNSFNETRSYASSHSNDQRSNIMSVNESSDKDAVINYLQKKLNETTRENERLNQLVKEMSQEKQKYRLELSKIDEYKIRIQSDETKIFALVNELERLDKLANHGLKDPNNENQMIRANQSYSNLDTQTQLNMKTLIDENLRLSKELAKKTQEVSFWKSKANPKQDMENSKSSLGIASEGMLKMPNHSPTRKMIQIIDSKGPNHSPNSKSFQTPDSKMSFPSPSNKMLQTLDSNQLSRNGRQPLRIFSNEASFDDKRVHPLHIHGNNGI